MKIHTTDIRVLGELVSVEYYYHPPIPALLDLEPDRCDPGDEEIVEIISAKFPLCNIDLLPFASNGVIHAIEQTIIELEGKKNENY
jgi:hypothetical protein